MPEVTIDGQVIEITHPERVLFPERGITKQEVIEYYRRTAPESLPHLRGRPVTMVRLSGDVHGGSFFQKAIPRYFPPWIPRAEVPRKGGGTTTYARCEAAADLVYMVNQGTLTFHVWLSRADRPEYPDRMVLDLDPPGEEFAPVRTAARATRELLEALGLVCFALATGSRGLHVVVPLAREWEFDRVRGFAQEVAARLARRYPEELTNEPRKAKRRGRLYLDTARNAYAQTTVAPYSVRARPEAPVAMPVTWEELEAPDFTPRRYRLREVEAQLAGRADPWARLAETQCSLGEAQRRLAARLPEA